MKSIGFSFALLAAVLAPSLALALKTSSVATVTLGDWGAADAGAADAGADDASTADAGADDASTADAGAADAGAADAGGTDVGVWTILGGTPVFDETYQACRYRVVWKNAASPPRTAELYLDEWMLPGFEDCEMNAKLSLPTIIFDTRGIRNYGFDEQQQLSEIGSMVLGEDVDGGLSGLVQFVGSGFNFNRIVITITDQK